MRQPGLLYKPTYSPRVVPLDARSVTLIVGSLYCNFKTLGRIKGRWICQWRTCSAAMNWILSDYTIVNTEVLPLKICGYSWYRET